MYAHTQLPFTWSHAYSLKHWAPVHYSVAKVNPPGSRTGTTQGAVDKGLDTQSPTWTSPIM